MPKLKTTNEFIIEALLVHGNKYDYSKVEYINSNKKVIIICKEHGDFLQTPNKHLQGGCKLCGFSKQANTRTKTKENFIIEAIKKHGDTYDYSKVEYKNNMCKIIIICKKHGDFLQVAGSHLQGHGCKKCSTIINSKNQKSNTEEFILRAIEIHGNVYDYSKVKYINSNEKVIIICKEHGEFLQNLKGHIHKKCGCSKCGIIKQHNKLKLSNEKFIIKSREIHGDKYDYSKVNYDKNGKNPVIIICKKHGEFNQTPQEHLSGCGCSKCGKVYKKNTNEYIELVKKVHGDKYDYSKTLFKKAKDKIIITCKTHGDFYQEAYCHSIGVGCPICINKGESKIHEKLISIFPSLLTQFNNEWCKRKRFDFCIPEYKIIIELDGPQHFIQIMNWDSPDKQQENDKYKEECANQNGYSVIRLLQEDVFYDTYDWVKELCDAIEEVKSNEGITNVYLCKNDEYEQF